MKIILSVALTLVGTIGAMATPKIGFLQSSVTVSQRAGSVSIPVKASGEFDVGYAGVELPSFRYSTQGGTAISGTHYDGGGFYDFPRVEFQEENTTINISVPIYYTGSTVDRFFTIVLSDYIDSIQDTLTSVTVTILAEPKVDPIVFSFANSDFSVPQGAGSIQIPVTYTGTPQSDNVTLDYRTQPGTANGNDDYEGTSGSTVEFAPGANSALITIPVYNTGSVTTKFFNVLLVGSSEGQIGSPAAAKVTILKVKPKPQVQFLTKSAKVGRFRIYGNVTNVTDREVRRVSLIINGKPMTIKGKRNWYSAVRATSPGVYQMLVRVHLRNGKVLTRRSNLVITL